MSTLFYSISTFFYLCVKCGYLHENIDSKIFHIKECDTIFTASHIPCSVTFEGNTHLFLLFIIIFKKEILCKRGSYLAFEQFFFSVLLNLLVAATTSKILQSRWTYFQFHLSCNICNSKPVQMLEQCPIIYNNQTSFSSSLSRENYREGERENIINSSQGF